MAITKDGGRQYPLVAKVSFTYADLVSGSAIEAVDIPGGATVTGGALVITTAFDSVTSDNATVQVGSDTLLGSTSVAAVGQTLFTEGAAEVTAKDTVDITWTQVGGGTSAGAGYLIVEYILDNRSNEVQPV